MNHKQDKLENLLATKSYQDLLPEEKAWVDQHYTAEEYEAMHLTIMSSASIFKNNQTSPNPEIKSRLRQKLRQSKKPASVKPLFAYRIPAWQAVAAFALLLFFIPQLQNEQSTDPEKVFIYQTDTVFKEIPVESILDPLLDTISGIPKVRKIINRAPIKASTVVFSKDETLSSGLSQDISAYFADQYDTISVENVISRYLKDSVKSYRVDVDTGFQNIGQVY